MYLRVAFCAFLLMWLGAQASTAREVQDGAFEYVKTALNDEGVLNDLSATELEAVDRELKNAIGLKMAKYTADSLHLSEAEQHQFLLDTFRKIGSKIVGGIKSATKKLIRVGKSFVGKAGTFVKKHGARLVMLGKGLSSTLLPIAATIIAPELAIPVEVAAGLLASIKIPKGASQEQIVDLAADKAKQLMDKDN